MGMFQRLSRFYFNSAGALLAIAATAKLISVFGNSKILRTLDPIWGLPYRNVLWGAAVIELGVAGVVCFCIERFRLKAACTAWLATCFLLYRLGLFWIGEHKPCGCLGNLTDALGISVESADWALKAILLYLLIGSYVFLFWTRLKLNGSQMAD
jgi:hypothetical protein